MAAFSIQPTSNDNDDGCCCVCYCIFILFHQYMVAKTHRQTYIHTYTSTYIHINKYKRTDINILLFVLVTFPPIGVRSIVISVSVCLSVCSFEYLKNTRPHFTKFFKLFFKLAVTVHRCLNGRAPPYLSDYCVPAAGADTRQHLRSANRQLLAVPRYRLNTNGRQAF